MGAGTEYRVRVKDGNVAANRPRGITTAVLLKLIFEAMQEPVEDSEYVRNIIRVVAQCDCFSSSVLYERKAENTAR